MMDGSVKRKNRNRRKYKPKLIVGTDCKIDFPSTFSNVFLAFRLPILTILNKLKTKTGNTIEYVNFNIDTYILLILCEYRQYQVTFSHHYLQPGECHVLKTYYRGKIPRSAPYFYLNFFSSYLFPLAQSQWTYTRATKIQGIRYFCLYVQDGCPCRRPSSPIRNNPNHEINCHRKMWHIFENFYVRSILLCIYKIFPGSPHFWRIFSTSVSFSVFS